MIVMSNSYKLIWATVLLVIVPTMIAMVLLKVSAFYSPTLPEISQPVECIKRAENLADDEWRTSCKTAYSNNISYLRANYDRWSMETRGRIIAWQSISAILMFVLFLCILVFGLFLTYREFNKETKSPIKLNMGAGGIEVTSEIVGVVILVLSLGFTYLYIDRVYPIAEIAAASSN